MVGNPLRIEVAKVSTSATALLHLFVVTLQKEVLLVKIHHIELWLSDFGMVRIHLSKIFARSLQIAVASTVCV